MWRPTAYDEDDFAAFREAMKRQPDQGGADPRRLPAQLRLRGPRDPHKSRTSLIQSLRVGAGIGAVGVVLHPGSAKQGDVGRAIKRAGKVIGEALSESERCDAAPRGHRRRRRHARALVRGARRAARRGRRRRPARRVPGLLPPVRLRLRHPHRRRARPRRSTSSTASSVSSACGSLHVNDSKTALGSNRDRHALLGQGELGERGWRRSSPSRVSSTFRSCSRPSRAPSRSRSRSSCASAGRRRASAAPARAREQAQPRRERNARRKVG